ncbi:MAG: hypothetical protein AMXMBFR53_07130 [Gemmatimonadota bacterium]
MGTKPLPRLVAAALLLLVAGACASAGKRLEQGMEAEAGGDYHLAVSRYIQALEKDPALTEAREGLMAAWDAALAQGLAFAGEALESGDATGAAEEFLALDDLAGRARDVGADLPTPGDYATRRRGALDAAVADLMAHGERLRRERQWRDAGSAYRRVVDEMDPSPGQRRAALDARAEALVEWAEDDFLAGRPRAAFLRAGEALDVAAEVPAEVADAAASLRERALSSGLRVLAVFPVGSTAEVRRASLAELDAQLSDVLETEHWRRPPLFVAVADPARVRQVTRRFSPPGSELQPRRILEELGADFGALVEIVELTAEERDARTSTRAARTRDGRATSYTVEEGRIRYTLVAEVTLFDERGVRRDSFRARHTADDDFRRARYDGSFEELDLSRGERLLFNPGEERRVRALLQESMLGELAAETAAGIYQRVVDRIP